MRILWIEDDRGFLQRQAHLFGAWNESHEICPIAQYDDGWQQISQCLRDYDLAVFDIDLRHSGSTPLVKETAAKFDLQASEFLNSAGFHLYIHAAKQGFPEARMIFFTGNMAVVTAQSAAINQLRNAYDSGEDEAWNSAIDHLHSLIGEGQDITEFEQALESDEKSTIFGWLEKWSGPPPRDEIYEEFVKRFRQALLEEPHSIDKKSPDKGAEKLQRWLSQHCSPKSGQRDEFDYLTLRRGILDVLAEIAEDGNIQFTTDFKDNSDKENGKKDGLDKKTFLSGLAWQVRDFALPPSDYEKSYLALCDYLSKPFDRYKWCDALLNDAERHLKIPLYFLRNWIAHGLVFGSNTKITAQAAGIAFLLAMQHFFNVEKYGFQNELQRLFAKPVTDPQEWQNLCRQYKGNSDTNTALKKIRSFGFKSTADWDKQDFTQNFYAAYLLCLQQDDGSVKDTPFNAWVAGEFILVSRFSLDTPFSGSAG